MTWFRSALARLGAALPTSDRHARPAEILDEYTAAPPGPQNALDLFRQEWWSRLPIPFDRLRAGDAPLFEDPRVLWLVERLGGVRGMRVLELGPLEGGHSYMLDRAGAREIVAIEGNSRAFMKCLIVKELVGMPSVRFLHGDFTEYMAGEPGRFELVLASGVLYHMVNPVELIASIAKVSDNAFLWTHYYDESLLSRNPATSHRVVPPTPSEYRGYRHSLYRHEYSVALTHRGFCGGSRPFANWMTREGIMDALRHFGFARLETYTDQPDHPNGPALSVFASRKPGNRD